MTQPILSVQGVTVSFDGFTVLDNLDFSIDYGELRFLIGPNGAGKTTLLDLVTGKTRPQRGRVIFDGQVDALRHSEHQLVQLGIGRKFQTPSGFASLTVYENLEIALGFQGLKRQWRMRRQAIPYENLAVAQSARYQTGTQLRTLHGEESDRIYGTLEQVGLMDRAREKAGTLSHGEKQWLEIAMLLIQEPKLLLLDEPVAGMTRRERDRTGELLLTIGQHRSVLVVEHDMAFVRQFAQKVTVLHLGKVLSEGPMEMVQQDPQVIDAYLGHAKPRGHAVRDSHSA